MENIVSGHRFREWGLDNQHLIQARDSHWLYLLEDSSDFEYALMNIFALDAEDILLCFTEGDNVHIQSTSRFERKFGIRLHLEFSECEFSLFKGDFFCGRDQCEASARQREKNFLELLRKRKRRLIRRQRARR